MADEQRPQRVVREEDFRAAAERLMEFGVNLPPEQQIVLGMLIDKATEVGDTFAMSLRPEAQQPIGFQFAPGLDATGALANHFGGIRQALPERFGKIAQTYYHW